MKTNYLESEKNNWSITNCLAKKRLSNLLRSNCFGKHLTHHYIMKQITLLISFFFFITASYGQTENSKLKISHLTGDFYVYTTYKNLNNFLFPSNSMYLVTNQGVVLFDTPWDTTQFQPLLDSIFAKHQKQVVMAISTHFHDDRTAGLDFLNQQGVKTYTSKLTYNLSKQHNEKLAAFYFENDTTFEVGNHQFETFYAGKGHTEDNVVIWFENEKILYGGCLVKSTESSTLGNIADANLNDWEQTIRKVMKKYPKPKLVIPGHFGWKSNKGLKHTIKLVQQNNL